MGLDALLLDFQRRLGRELTEFEIRMCTHAWVNGLAEGVNRMNEFNGRNI